MNQLEVLGGCHCKQFQYSAFVNSTKTYICHCNDCQVLSGTAFRVSLPVSSDKFRVVSGKLKTYVKIAESGNKRAQCFCENCGTQIYATGLEDQSILNLRVGTIKDRKVLAPQSEKFTSEKLPWLESCKLVS